MSLSENLKRKRLALSLSQEELGISIGCKQKTITKAKTCDTDVLIFSFIADSLNRNANYLIKLKKHLSSFIIL